VLVPNVLGEVAFEFGAVRAKGALELGLFAALIPQMPHQRILPHVVPLAFGALEHLGRRAGRIRKHVSRSGRESQQSIRIVIRVIGAQSALQNPPFFQEI